MLNFKSKYFSFTHRDVLFFGFILLYLVVLVIQCIRMPLWEDEFYSLNTTSNNLSGVISQSYNFEAQPPVYFVLLKFWRLINNGVFFARFFSSVSVLLAAFFFSKLVRLLSGREFSRWVVIIFLLNPFTVWAALEIRGYALLLFLSSVSVYSFFEFYINDNRNYLFLFLIVSAIGLFTQYLFVFLIAALSFALLIFRGWKAFFKLCIYLIPLVLLFMLNFLFLPDNISNQQTDAPHFDLKYSIYSILKTPANLLLGIDKIPLGRMVNLIIVLVFSFFSLYTYFFLKKKEIIHKNTFLHYINFILAVDLIIVGMYVVAFPVFGVQYADLYMTIAFPLLMFLFVIFRFDLPLLRNIFFVSVCIYFVLLLVLTYRYPVKFYDFQSITKYVRTIEKKDEPILIYRNGLSLAFNYYYEGHNPIYPLPYELTFNRNYLVNIKDTSELRKSIGRISNNSGSCLFVSDDQDKYLYTKNMNREMIDAYLQSNYRITLDTFYFGHSKKYGLRIRRIEMPDYR
jgi:hypothetical protein